MSATEAGQELAAQLRASRITQKALALHLDVEPSYISRMVRGHINWATSSYFGQIASILAVPDDVLRRVNPGVVVNRPGAEVPTAVPPELSAAAMLYGELYPYICVPEVQAKLAVAGGFPGGPVTAQDWMLFFLDIRSWL